MIEAGEADLSQCRTTVGRYYQRNAKFTGTSSTCQAAESPVSATASAGSSAWNELPDAAPGGALHERRHHGTFRHELGDNSLIGKRIPGDLNFSPTWKMPERGRQPVRLPITIIIYTSRLLRSFVFSRSHLPSRRRTDRYRQNNVCSEVAKSRPITTRSIRFISKALSESVYSYNLRHFTLPLHTPPLSVLSEDQL